MTDSGKVIKMEVKAGDKVLFTKYGPTEVKVDGKELLVLNMSDVLAVID
jgi:chaperonin GroES